jgi:hypothetical protein
VLLVSSRRLANAALIVVSASLAACKRSPPAPSPAPSAAVSEAPGASASSAPLADAPLDAGLVPVPSGAPPRPRSAEPIVGEVDMPAPPTAPQARGAADGVEALRAIFADYGFPGAPGLTHLCGQRVYRGSGTHLSWDAFAATAPPAELLEHYQAKLGKRGFDADGVGGTWRVPEREPQRTLQVLAPTSPSPHTSCGKRPGADAKSVLLLSRND